MQFVQLTLTTEHVQMLSDALNTHAPEPEAQDEFLVLEHFINEVGLHPERFPVRGQMAKSLKTRMRLAKGPSETPSRKHKRKDRQERRMRTAKARRAERKETAANFNQARERMEADIREAMEIAEERARRREVLAQRDELTFDEVEELFELFDAPHVAKFLRDEHDLTTDERLARAARDREEHGIGSNA